MASEKQRDHFTFFKSFLETIDLLPAEIQLPFFRAITDFAFFGRDPVDLADVGKACWPTIRAVLESGKKKARAGAIGGEHGRGVSRNVGNQNAAKTKKSASTSNPSPRFMPPTEAEVAAYCAEMGYTVDAERFCDYYASKGWVVGKTPMKDWKAAVRTWMKNARPAKPGQPANVPAHKKLAPRV